MPRVRLRAAPNVAELQIEVCGVEPGSLPRQILVAARAPATGSLLFIAPDEYSPCRRPADSQRLAARTSYAAALFDLAKQAADAGQLSLAFQWATETVRENPDHADARRVLGYETARWPLADGLWREDVAMRVKCGSRSGLGGGGRC